MISFFNARKSETDNTSELTDVVRLLSPGITYSLRTVADANNTRRFRLKCSSPITVRSGQICRTERVASKMGPDSRFDM